MGAENHDLTNTTAFKPEEFMALKPADFAAIRISMLQRNFGVFFEHQVDTWLQCLGDFPEGWKCVTVVDYALQDASPEPSEARRSAEPVPVQAETPEQELERLRAAAARLAPPGSAADLNAWSLSQIWDSESEPGARWPAGQPGVGVRAPSSIGLSESATPSPGIESGWVPIDSVCT